MDNGSKFLQAGNPSCHPSNDVKATRGSKELTAIKEHSKHC